MSAYDAAIWIDPARQGGSPCLYGTRIPVGTVASQVAHGGVDYFMKGYGPLERRQVLIACAWWTLYWPISDYKSDDAQRKAWRRWALKAWREMPSLSDVEAASIKDPPRSTS